jgi:hypothetical protein
MAAALKALVGSDALLSPAELAKRKRRRWYKRGAIGCGLVMVGLAAAIWAGVTLFRTLTGGPPPAVDLMAPAIPAALRDSALALGLIEPGDAARYIFVPAGGGMADAMVVGATHLSRIHRGAVRRWELNADDNYMMSLRNKQGFFIITAADKSASDTLYTTLKGKELTSLRAAITRVFEARAADSLLPTP